MKKILIALLAAALLPLAALAADAAPKTVIHVVSVKWKADAKPEQVQAALDGVHTLQKEYPGITRVWTKTIKKQGDWSAVFVMEFKDEKALKDYADSPAQKKWYETYVAVRERSNSHDITN